MHLVVAVNPRSAFGKHGGVGERVREAFVADAHEVTLLERDSFAELEAAVTDALQSGADALLVVGGDGMVSLGVNAVASTTIPLGIVAAGTGNDMARGLGLPIDSPEQSLDALRALLTTGPRLIDVAEVFAANGVSRRFGCVLSAGFDALVNERANRMRFPRGASKYVIAVLLELAQLRSRRYELTVDGVTRDVDAVIIAVANNRSLGGGMMIAPTAEVNDGMLDIMIAHRLSRLGLLRLLPIVFRGEHLGHPAVEHLRGTSIRISTENVVAYADGERVGPLPISVRVQPRALSIYAP